MVAEAVHCFNLSHKLILVQVCYGGGGGRFYTAGVLTVLTPGADESGAAFTVSARFVAQSTVVA